MIEAIKSMIIRIRGVFSESVSCEYALSRELSEYVMSAITETVFERLICSPT